MVFLLATQVMVNFLDLTVEVHQDILIPDLHKMISSLTSLFLHSFPLLEFFKVSIRKSLQLSVQFLIKAVLLNLSIHGSFLTLLGVFIRNLFIL